MICTHTIYVGSTKYYWCIQYGYGINYNSSSEWAKKSPNSSIQIDDPCIFFCLMILCHHYFSWSQIIPCHMVTHRNDHFLILNLKYELHSTSVLIPLPFLLFSALLSFPPLPSSTSFFPLLLAAAWVISEMFS